MKVVWRTAWLVHLQVGLVTLALALLGSPAWGRSTNVDCVSDTIGVDIALADGFNVAAYLGRSVAQVFRATDTLIESITVWRPLGPDSNITGMHLFITKVDSTTGEPDPSQIVLDGPTIVLPDTGSGSKPATYSFDPPFVLPSQGLFAFAIKEGDPICDSAFTLKADSAEPYPYGHAWQIYPFFNCQGLGSAPTNINADMIFQIVFCSPTVPTLRTTWGRVRATYR